MIRKVFLGLSTSASSVAASVTVLRPFFWPFRGGTMLNFLLAVHLGGIVCRVVDLE